jgi:hypothetical protein
MQLTAQQALMEISALLSTTEGDARHQIRLILDCVPDEEKSKLKSHPLYLHLKKHTSEIDR